MQTLQRQAETLLEPATPRQTWVQPGRTEDRLRPSLPPTLAGLCHPSSPGDRSSGSLGVRMHMKSKFGAERELFGAAVKDMVLARTRRSANGATRGDRQRQFAALLQDSVPKLR